MLLLMVAAVRLLLGVALHVEHQSFDVEVLLVGFGVGLVRFEAMCEGVVEGSATVGRIVEDELRLTSVETRAASRSFGRRRPKGTAVVTR